MKVKLVIANGVHAGSVITVTRKQFVIGRHRDCQMRVTSPKFSVYHCAILIRKDGIWVRDFDSTNGTFVNDERIDDDRELRTGDVLRMGSLTLQVQLEEESKPASISETAAAQALHEVMNEQFGRDIEEGFLLMGPDSIYDSTELKLPSLTEEEFLKKKPKRNE